MTGTEQVLVNDWYQQFPSHSVGTLLFTGAGVTGNPFFASTDPNKRRIVAYGLRNPFRFTQRPGTDELWIGDVGWPCYEGASLDGSYKAAGLNLCAPVYATPESVTAPYYTYNHGACVVNYTGCHTGGSSITGIAFYQGGSYPAAYDGAVFFGDHSRNEIWRR
jgi:glucose/arabinose dehydrogenase